MWNDEIVEEVRRMREVYAREHQYNIDEISRDIKEKEHESNHPLICTPPKRPVSQVITHNKKADAA